MASEFFSDAIFISGFYRCRFAAIGESFFRFSFRVYMRGKEYQKCSENNRGDVKRRTDVPTEVFGDILEDRERGIARTYEKHIDGSAGSIAEDHVDAERDNAKREKGKGSVQIILSRFSETVGRDQINADEDQQHMPDIRVECERPIAVCDAGRLDKRHDPAEQIIGGYKSVYPVTDGPGLQKNRNDAKIHWYAAKLEWEDPPDVRVVTHVKTIEKLLVYFRQNEEASDTSENDFVSLFRKLAELSGEQNTNGNSDKGERKVENAICGRRSHFPSGSFQ